MRTTERTTIRYLLSEIFAIAVARVRGIPAALVKGHVRRATQRDAVWRQKTALQRVRWAVAMEDVKKFDE